jgi:hypothetical protein
MAEMILARIQHCRYCGREMKCSALEYQENPFCTVCLPERVGKASLRGRIHWKGEGDYITPEVSRKHLPSGNRRHQG